jgi:hypothetical protein
MFLIVMASLLVGFAVGIIYGDAVRHIASGEVAILRTEVKNLTEKEIASLRAQVHSFGDRIRNI